MALDLRDTYGISNTAYGQISNADPTGYPYGAAQNEATYNDGTGTPLEKTWLNDLFGFQQAMLVAAGIVPSGTPDKVGASQYLDALQAFIGAPIIARLNAVEARMADVEDAHAALSSTVGHLQSFALYSIGTNPTDDGSRFNLTQTFAVAPGSGDFSLSSDRITVPRNGKYHVTVTGTLDCSAAEGARWAIALNADATLLNKFDSGSADDLENKLDRLPFALTYLLQVTDKATQRINVTSLFDDQTCLNGMIFVHQLAD